MGSYIETNDTLRITKAQGFPSVLDINKHLVSPYSLDIVKNQAFSFTAKPAIRIYQAPPVRNFLVEFLDEKWIYWGRVHILEITHDYINKMTSGKYKIIEIFSPEEMKKAHKLIDANPNTDYFS